MGVMMAKNEVAKITFVIGEQNPAFSGRMGKHFLISYPGLIVDTDDCDIMALSQ
jgi:hypothetical protein